ncbi:DUF5802 family protein [Salinirubellus salinus]|uniref:DUF5802 family protein n=1 Tax=Salinirubellus salinus TaxID=1364945 RepID=A0A9E7UBW6_9EURY|nr:DUF5802 family protein [Salinirubellus salinus]UWM55592.1 DUF5802 family protein [Salinirubellus salinus]
MFEPFSGAYYLGRLYLEPHDAERVVMQRAQHERVNEQLYGGEDAAIRRLDHPLVMKVGNAHLSVHGADDVPERTLGFPPGLLERLDVDAPTLSEVLLAKAERAEQLLSLGGTDTAAV